MKTRKPKKPVYSHPRTAYAGIEERLALASLAFSKTFKRGENTYLHTARYLGKEEGWEANMVWIDSYPTVNPKAADMERDIAEAIEGARLAWWENQHPSKELLEIVANAKAKAYARKEAVAA